MIDDKTLERYQPQIEEALESREQVFDIAIKDDSDAVMASQLIKEVSTKIKAVEAERKEITKPLLESKRNLDKFFKKITNPLEDINKHLRKELVKYEKEKEAARQLAQAEARKAALLGAPAEEIKDLITESVKPSVKVSGVSVRNVWKARVLDFSQLPDEFKMVDEQALKRYAKENQDQKQVPGVQFYLDKAIRA